MHAHKTKLKKDKNMAIIVETDRLIVREMEPDDYDDLCEILKDPEVMYTYEHAFSDAECLSWMSKQFLRYKRDGFGVWAVVNKKTGEFVGQCGVTTISIEGKPSYELGYLFKRKHWDKGYATEAANACMRYAFKVLKLDVVCSLIREENVRAQNVAKRLGMKNVSKNKRHYWGAIMHEQIYVAFGGRVVGK